MTRRNCALVRLVALVLFCGCDERNPRGHDPSDARFDRMQRAVTGPLNIAVSHGNLYFADTSTHLVRKVDRKHLITTVAGDGWHAKGSWFEGRFRGDGGPATKASLNSPEGVALGSDGTLYVADTGNGRVRKVDPDGVVTTMAGGGIASWRRFDWIHAASPRKADAIFRASIKWRHGDGGPAIKAEVTPTDVAIGADGSLYIADESYHRIRKVDPKGIMTTVAGDGWTEDGGDEQGRFAGDGGAAVRASLSFPSDVALGADGSLYIADSWNHRVRKVDLAGIITTVAGNGETSYAGDGGPATKAGLDPQGVAVGGDGSLYVADSWNHRVRKVDPKGVITTVAGTNREGFSGDGGSAIRSSLSWPHSVAMDSDGTLYIADDGNQSIRKVDPEGTITTVVLLDKGTK